MERKRDWAGYVIVLVAICVWLFIMANVVWGSPHLDMSQDGSAVVWFGDNNVAAQDQNVYLIDDACLIPWWGCGSQ